MDIRSNGLAVVAAHRIHSYARTALDERLPQCLLESLFRCYEPVSSCQHGSLNNRTATIGQMYSSMYSSVSLQFLRSSTALSIRLVTIALLVFFTNDQPNYQLLFQVPEQE